MSLVRVPTFGTSKAVGAVFRARGRSVSDRSTCWCRAPAGNFLAEAENISANGFKSVIDIDLLGTFHVLKQAYAHLRRPGAAVINIHGSSRVGTHAISRRTVGRQRRASTN